MMNTALRGKPDAGNPHVRFDEGEVAPENPRRGSLLYNMFSKLFPSNDTVSSDELQLIKSQVDAYITGQGVDLSSDDFGWYYGLCYILGKYTHNELTTSVVMSVCDKVDSIIRKPSFIHELPIHLRRFAVERAVSVTAGEVCPSLSQHARENLAICFWIVYGRILGDEEQPTVAEACKLFKSVDVGAIDGLKARFYANGWIPVWERAGH